MDTILVIDDHPMVGLAIEQVVGTRLEGNYQVESRSTAKEGLDFVKANNYALIILDVFMPNADTHDIIHQILRIKPESKILINSSANEDIYALLYIKQGASGFISKSASLEKLEKAIRTVLTGERYVSRKTMDRLIDDLNGKRSANPFNNLSNREIEVAKLLAEGKGVKEIAQILNVHSSTIGTQKKSLFKELGITGLNEFYDLCKVYGFVASN